MAAVEVTITGMLYDTLARTTQRVVLIGEATLTGLGVGGGPIIPPSGGGGGDRPIAGWPVVPGWPGGSLPGGGAGFPGGPPYPDHTLPGPQPPGNRPGAIVPPMPEQPPTTPSEPTTPDSNKGWAWHPAYGWGFFPPNQAVPKE